MVQTALAYLAVALAAAWVVWSILLPRSVKQQVRARLAAPKATPPGKAGCDCGGDGSCH